MWRMPDISLVLNTRQSKHSWDRGLETVHTRHPSRDSLNEQCIYWDNSGQNHPVLTLSSCTAASPSTIQTHEYPTWPTHLVGIQGLHANRHVVGTPSPRKKTKASLSSGFPNEQRAEVRAPSSWWSWQRWLTDPVLPGSKGNIWEVVVVVVGGGNEGQGSWKKHSHLFKKNLRAKGHPSPGNGGIPVFII